MIGPVETKTLILYGPEDRVVPKDFPKQCELGFRNRVGPLYVPEAGHFLQWERADILNASQCARANPAVVPHTSASVREVRSSL